MHPQRKMSFDPAWASHFSDPAWVAIELYARVVSPLQLIVEFQDLPYIPFGQQQPCRMAIRDVGRPRMWFVHYRLAAQGGSDPFHKPFRLGGKEEVRSVVK